MSDSIGNRRKWFIGIGSAVLVLAMIAWPVACRRADAWAGEVKCVNHMVSIGSAGMIWASDNEDVLPTTFFSMSNEVASPFILICPSRRESIKNLPWDPDADYYDYEIIATNLTIRGGPVPFIRCKVHDDHVGYTDGRVFDGKRWRRKFPG